MIEILLVLLFFVGLLVFSLAYLRLSYIHPCIIAQAYWLLLGVFPFVFLKITTKLNLPLEGLLYIWASLLLMVAGAYLLPVKYKNRQSKDFSASWRYLKNKDLSVFIRVHCRKYLGSTIHIVIAVGTLSIIATMASTALVLMNGIDISTDIISVGAQFAGKRNISELESSSLLTGAQNLSVYVSALLVGRYIIPQLLVESKYSMILLCLLPPFAAVISIALFQGQKGIVALFFFLIVGGFILFILDSSLPFSGLVSLLTTKSAKILVLLVIIFTSIGLFLPFLSRGFLTTEGGLADNAVILSEENPLIVYAMGHLPNFLQWFHDSVIDNHPDPSYPVPFVYTFRDLALFVLSSENPLPPGIYDDYRMGNIYTVYRGMINDFGIFGSLITSALFGAFATIGFSSYRSGKKYVHIIGQIACIYFFSILFQSYIVSSFVWKSTLVLPFVYVCFDKVITSYSRTSPISS